MMELFEKYHAGAMSDSDRKEFENRLATDVALASEYEDYVMMMDHLSTRVAVNGALANLDEIHQTYTEDNGTSKAVVKRVLPRWLAVAASMIAISAAVFLMMDSSADADAGAVASARDAASASAMGGSDGHVLYAQYYRPAQIDLTTKALTDGVEDKWSRLSFLYNEAEYIATISLYDSNTDLYASQPAAILMYANALMSAKRHGEAQKALAQISDTGNFASEKLYYQGLNNLAMGRVLMAKDVLSQIPPTSNYYQNASQIIDRLQ